MKYLKANKRLKLLIRDNTDLKMGWLVWLDDLGATIFLKSFKTRNEARNYVKQFKKVLP